MIAICEPQCIGFAHEAINSAFVYGVRLAFPDEKIVFFADQSHIDAIKRMFIINNLVVDNIEYRPIIIQKLTYFTFSATFFSYILFRKLFRELSRLGINHLLLLSISSDGLYAIKMLKSNSISCSLVLHAVFEWITEGPYNPYKTIIHRKIFNFKSAIEWNHSNNFNYIVLSPHILNEADKYVNITKYNISSIYLPFIFSKYEALNQKNEYIKFATIGKGSPSKIRSIAIELNKKNTLKYEIRVLGNSVEGIENIENVRCICPNRRFSRDEVYEQVKDIDIFLYLYDKDTYSLSCSGALFEAFSYVKPIIYLSNPCFDYYNNVENIGYKCENLEDVITKMKYLINNFGQNSQQLDTMKENIIRLRNTIDIKNTTNTNKLRDIVR